MLDSSHGSAYPSAVLDDARNRDIPEVARPYRGCTSLRPRCGVARTRPWAARLAAADHDARRRSEAAAFAAIVLELGEAPWAGVPCWTGRAERWVTFTVPVAYDCRYDTQVRPVMGDNQVSRTAVVVVAAARARYAEHATGRQCRPSNERLAADTGYSVRTVQRADAALRLLGVATEVLRGRQRTLVERLASWRVGDRGRGWASVWALHEDAQLARLVQALSPHPEGSLFSSKPCGESVVTTEDRRPGGVGRRTAARRAGPDAGGLALARAWRADAGAPPWARRHSPAAWAGLLAAPAAHQWTPRDLNQLVTDWLGVGGRRIPDYPHKPIGLLGAMLAWHGTEHLAERPAALDEAREAAELAAHQTHLAEQHTAHTEHQCAPRRRQTHSSCRRGCRAPGGRGGRGPRACRAQRGPR